MLWSLFGRFSKFEQDCNLAKEEYSVIIDVRQLHQQPVGRGWNQRTFNIFPAHCIFSCCCLLTPRLPGNLWPSFGRACADPPWKSSARAQCRSCHPPRPRPHSASQRGLEATPGQIPLSRIAFQGRHPWTRPTGLAWTRTTEQLRVDWCKPGKSQTLTSSHLARSTHTLTQWWEEGAGWSHIPEEERVWYADLKRINKTGRKSEKSGSSLPFKASRTPFFTLWQNDIRYNDNKGILSIFYLICMNSSCVNTKCPQISGQIWCCTVVVLQECPEDVLRETFVLQGFRQRVVIFQYNIVYSR